MLEGKSVAFKNDLLFEYGINFNDLPTWQRRGIGLYWGEYDKEGYDPIQKQAVVVKRRRIEIDRELPIKEAYTEFISRILGDARIGMVGI